MANQIRACSYGGGVQSTALLVLAAQRMIDYLLFLFSNVGNDSEHPATLAYVHDVAMPYAEQHGIELVALTRTGRGTTSPLYERLTNDGSRSIPIPMRMSGTGAPGTRNCTATFKIDRIASELKRRGATEAMPALTALGISLDEWHRMRAESGIPHQVLAYPLIDMRLTRQDCMNIIERAGLPVPPKSSCWFCPFHTLTKWREMRDKEPALFEQAADLEALLNERRSSLGKDPMWLTRRLVPLREAVGTVVQAELWSDELDVCESGYCMT